MAGEDKNGKKTITIWDMNGLPHTGEWVGYDKNGYEVVRDYIGLYYSKACAVSMSEDEIYSYNPVAPDPKTDTKRGLFSKADIAAAAQPEAVSPTPLSAQRDSDQRTRPPRQPSSFSSGDSAKNGKPRSSRSRGSLLGVRVPPGQAALPAVILFFITLILLFAPKLYLLAGYSLLKGLLIAAAVVVLFVSLLIQRRGVAMQVTLGICLMSLLLLIVSNVLFPKRIGTIEIEKASQLVYLRRFPSGDFLLTADLNLDGGKWKPVSEFEGTFDGDGFTIFNFVVASKSNAALFGKNSGEISNLKIDSASLSAGNAVTNAAILAAVNEGSIKNCAVTGSTLTASGKESVGMLAAVNTGVISGCYTDGSLTGGTNVGGLVGLHYINGSSSLDLSISTATVISSSDSAISSAGGLIGRVAASDKNLSGSIENCAASGSVTLSNISAESGAYCAAGGLIGLITTPDKLTELTLSDCYAVGEVLVDSGGTSSVASAAAYGGGLIGCVYSESSPNALAAKVTGIPVSLDSCFAVGKVTAKSSLSKAAAYSVVGYTLPEAASLTNCYCITGQKVAATTIAETNGTAVDKSSLQSATFISGALEWGMDVWRVDSGYPVLIDLITANGSIKINTQDATNPGSEDTSGESGNGTPDGNGEMIDVYAIPGIEVFPDEENVFTEAASYISKAENGLNMRTGPASSYAKVTLVPFASQLKGYAEQGGWTLVQYGESYGWVSSEYISK